VTEAMDSRDQLEEGWEEESAMCAQQPSYTPTLENSRYKNLKKYIQHGTAPTHLKSIQKRSLRLKSTHYHLTGGVIFKINYDGVLLRCLDKQDANKFLKELHDRLARGHFVGETTAHKILRAR
jgi:hypothetical protein